MNEKNPRNCLNSCPFQNTGECPAIIFEQKEHMHGFATLAITVTGIVGCATYPEPALVQETPPLAPPGKPPVPSKKRK
jgi:hypothetical protein